MNHELSMKLDSARAASLPDEVEGTARPSALKSPAARHGATRVGHLTGIARPAGAARPRFDGVLDRARFATQLECEKRRADRSGMPLSAVLFRLADSRAGDGPSFDELIHMLCRDKRQTDFVGCLDDDLVAVLLPDTSEQGAARFVDKISAVLPSPALSAMIETYPDDLLEFLRCEQAAPATAIGTFAKEDAWPRRRGSEVVKRFVDFMGAGFGLLVLAPLMAIVAIAIVWTSPGPVLYSQTRLGRGGRPFTFYKFRSMYRDADERVHREYVTGLIVGGAVTGVTRQRPWAKLESDPRITRVGRFLRKTCLDELPQLFNVLKGDLSLVGPRPPLPYEAAAYRSWHLRRVLDVKPGITGLWQVEGRNMATFDDMVRMDLRYVRCRSLALDMKILLKTVVIVLSKRGGG